jgi:hypothetical protein
MYKIIARAAVGGTAALALAACGLLGAAGAGAAQVATHYSEFLAGHAMQGNGSQAFEAVWGGATVPNPGPSVPANSVAAGLVMAASPVNGSETFGLGLVWDYTSSTCGSGAWALAAGSANLTGMVPGPVPISAMSPLTEFGADVCIQPGQKLWMKMQQSTAHGILSYIVGPTESNNDVVDQVHGVHEHFLTTGEGVTTTNGTAAGDLNSGTLVSFDTWAVTDLASHHAGAHATNRNALAFNYATYTGTVTGNPNTPLNPITLDPSSFTKVGFGSANTVTVP